MDDKTKASLTNLETWKRGLFMVVFAIISGLAKLIVAVVAVFQFVTLLIKGQTNETMVPFGQNLSTYIYQLTTFLTFNTDVMPFPFMDFPNGAPQSNVNEGNGEYMAASDESAFKDDEVVDVNHEKNSDDIAEDKNSKDDPLTA
jgi:hypothetical protein